jgi:hypothetical protein
MISKTSLRFIYLLDTYNRARIPLTYEQIARILEESPYSSMSGLPILTFHKHRKGIKEMFGVVIECDKARAYIYYIM